VHPLPIMRCEPRGCQARVVSPRIRWKKISRRLQSIFPQCYRLRSTGRCQEFLDWAKSACAEEPAFATEVENNGWRPAALNIVEEALRAGHSHVDIYLDIVADALHRVGKLWELNRVSVAQEHMATALTRRPSARTNGGNRRSGRTASDWSQPGGRFLGSNSPLLSALELLTKARRMYCAFPQTLVSNLPSAAIEKSALPGSL
jgi:hypothetical protein